MRRNLSSGILYLCIEISAEDLGQAAQPPGCITRETQRLIVAESYKLDSMLYMAIQDIGTDQKKSMKAPQASAPGEAPDM